MERKRWTHWLRSFRFMLIGPFQIWNGWLVGRMSLRAAEDSSYYCFRRAVLMVRYAFVINFERSTARALCAAEILGCVSGSEVSNSYFMVSMVFRTTGTQTLDRENERLGEIATDVYIRIHKEIYTSE